MAKDDLNYPAREKTYFTADSKVPNLYVKVIPSGHRTWVVRCRIGKSKSKREIKIGDLSKITVQMARDKAKKVIADITVGIIEPNKLKSVRFKEVADRWLKNLKVHDRDDAYIENCDRIIRLHLNPKLGDLYVTDVHRTNILGIMDSMAAAGKPDLARKIRGTVSMILNFAVERGWVEHNAAAQIRNKTKAVKRDRVLTKEQLRKVKEALSGGQLGQDTADVIRVLMHTGQRRGEVLGMTWDELDFEESMWRLPASRTKNGQAHNVPLSNQVLALLKKRMPEDPKPGTEVFSVAVYTIGQACRRIAGRHKFPVFGSHDFRRTLASTLPEVDPAVNEDQIRRIINHTSGRGALAHYAHYRYDDEKRQTLQKWSDWLDRL